MLRGKPTGQLLPILRDGKIPVGWPASTVPLAPNGLRIFGLQTLYS